ncbi:hypothetical protein TIFTF001_017186 [Ficus carica]|uniref:Uncharacterized protein n=1 Tax=Ficus carica TaxID=3494 RepID=A0AA88A4H8_FICCA|nr:hypothetical protein TIFTF001_017186 [Ficus carica]
MVVLSSETIDDKGEASNFGIREEDRLNYQGLHLSRYFTLFLPLSVRYCPSCNSSEQDGWPQGQQQIVQPKTQNPTSSSSSSSSLALSAIVQDGGGRTRTLKSNNNRI